MYVWLWRKLPGPLAARLAGCAVLIAAAVAVLFLLVFPRVEPLLPFSDVTVDRPASAPATSGPG